jgi:hypothetical protein
MALMKKLTPYFVDLTKDACLKAFWRRRALHTFLIQHKISDTQLATWAQDESKREYLNRLFESLIKITDNSGYAIILDMARSLVEMKSFPDLENWEDSSEKISNAHKAVDRLKSEVDKLNKHVQNEKEIQIKRQKSQEQRLQNIHVMQTLEKLQTQLDKLVIKQGTQKAGYEFEKWFYDLVDFFEIQSRRPYKDPNGRQIDGSITIDGTTFLIETKFTANKIGSESIDIFLSKINRKADNTMGIMLSMAGFNDNAIKNASRDRTPLLLMDYSHIYNLILPQLMSLTEVIQSIWRNASQTGHSFLAVNNFSR